MITNNTVMKTNIKITKSMPEVKVGNVKELKTILFSLSEVMHLKTKKTFSRHTKNLWKIMINQTFQDQICTTFIFKH